MADLSALGQLWVNPESTFSTDADPDGSDYVLIPAEGMAWKPTHATIEREVQRAGLLQSIESQAGGKGGQLTLKVGLQGLSTVAASTVQGVIAPWLSRLLKACGYVEAATTGTTVAGAGSTTTSVDVTLSTSLVAGTMVMIGGEARLVTARSVGNITVTPPLTSAPANGVVVYGSSTWYLDDAGTYTPTYCSFALKRHNTEVTITGCAGTVMLEPVDAKGRAMLSFTFEADSWATTTSKSSVPATFTAQTNLLAMASPFWWGSTKTAVARFGFDPGLALSEMPSTQGTQGRAGWAITGENARITATPYQADSTYRGDFATPTSRNTLLQIGATGGAAFAVAFQVGQLVELPADADIGGLRGNDLVIRARQPTTTALPGLSFAFF